MAFGAFIKQQRLVRGWSLEVAARRMGISYSRLSEIERGKSYRTMNKTLPSRELIARMAVAFDLPVSLLLSEAGLPPDKAPEISSDAHQILSLYEGLSPGGKRLALGMLRVLAERGPDYSADGNGSYDP